MPKPPVSIRIIALALIVLGALSISNIAIGLIFQRSVPLDLNVFLVPLGIGLLRQSEVSRQLITFLCGLCGFALALVALAEILFLFYTPPPSVKHAGFTVAAIGLMVFGFTWKALRSPKTMEWFQEKQSQEESRRPFQFRIPTLLFCTFLVALICTVFRSEFIYHPREVVTTSASVSPAVGLALVTYGFRRHRHDDSLSIVDFVVIEVSKGTNSLTSFVTNSQSSAYREANAILTAPAGEIITLPGENQLYEIKDGLLRTLPGTVTFQQLENYLNQRQGLPSIDDLLSTPVVKSK